MPTPANRDETRAILLGWTLGDASAADFLLEIAELARLADDVVDKDTRRQERVMALLNRCLMLLPNNAFFRRHAELLAPAMNEALVGWRLGDEWRKSDDPKRRTFGYVYRESTDRIAVAVAFIIGGHEHSARVARELYDAFHAPFTETVEQWAEEA